MNPNSPHCITAYKAIIIHSLSLNTLQIYRPGLLGVNENGVITFCADLTNATTPLPSYDEYVDLGERFLVPGFIDGHAHAPQYSFVGAGMHLPLLEWLEAYTFPSEAKFADSDYAKQIYNQSVRRHLYNGTTTCSYFATIHLSASQILADLIETYGQRGYIGKVNMDRNSPSDLIESTSQSLADTQSFIDYVLSKNNELLTPVITPRFVPSTTSELMTGLAELSRKYDPFLPVQSHLSENVNEVEWVKHLHQDSCSYTQVYDGHGLLHNRSYMAHCIHCGSGERDLLKEKGTGIIHCPNSNFSLSSGVLNVRRLLNEGMKVGLGTDVSGGYSPSMLDAIRQAVSASKLVNIGLVHETTKEATDADKYEALSYKEAFYLATMGSAECLGLGEKVGNFEVGKQFDGLVVNSKAQNSPIDQTTHDTTEEVFQRFLFCGDDRNIEQVYVKGKRVKDTM